VVAFPLGANIMGAQTFREGFGTVVLQPTTLCNLNCSYCYLPERQTKSYIELSVLESIAASLLKQQLPVTVLWHGGEPLATGIERFARFLEPFAEAVALGYCQHSLQTNATLLTQEWCDFLKQHKFRIGVSIDGDPLANASRQFWNGRPAWASAIKGIRLLRENGIPYGIIAVANHANIDNAAAVYDSLAALGPSSISINVEESEGLNLENEHVSDASVRKFWAELYEHWRAVPNVAVRQFSDCIRTVQAIRNGDVPQFNKRRSFYPTVSANGDVVLLAPELASADLSVRKQFVAGNVLDTSLEEIIASGVDMPYVREFLNGLAKCEAECDYFLFCGGGQASNKFFEHGRFDVSETRYCRNSKIAPTETVLSYLEGGQA
jgi:uncharacterized protein